MSSLVTTTVPTKEATVQISFPTITLGKNRVDAFQRLLGLLAVVGGLSYIYIPLLRAKFGFWGEHELMDLIGPSGHMPWEKLVSLVGKWQFLTKPGHYCPLHQLIIYLESFFIGGNPEGWHALRLFELLLCGIFLYFSLISFLGPLLAVVCTLYLFIGEQAEIWMFLAQEEIHGFIFAAIGAVLMARVYSTAKPQSIGILASLICFLLAGASSEAYTLMLPSILIILLMSEYLYPSTHGKLHTLWSWSKPALICIVALSVLQVVLMVHAQQANATTRTYFDLFRGGTGTEVFWAARFCSLIPILTYYTQAVLSERFRPELAKMGVFGLILFIAGVFPQWLFYGDYFYTLELFLTPALSFVLLYWVLVFHQWKIRALPDDGKLLLNAVAFVSLFAELCWGVELHRRFITKSGETIDTDRITTSAVQLGAKNPMLDYLICADYHQIEMVNIVSNYLSFKGGRPVRPFLKVNMKNIEQAYPFLQSLGRKLEEDSVRGNTYLSPNSGNPLSPDCCVTIALSSDPKFCHEYGNRIALK